MVKVRLMDMTYGRKYLRLDFLKSYAVPHYLSSGKHRGLIEEVIKFYECNVGRRYGSIDWDELRIIVGDDRLYGALRKVMNTFYRPRTPSLKPIANPRSLRMKVFQIVNERYGGFIPEGLKDEALREIRNMLKLDVDIDELLWLDDINEQPLMRVRGVSVEDVVRVFNYETIDTVCVNSSQVRMVILRFEQGLGRLTRDVGRFCKLYGLIYDMKYVSKWLRVSVEGPSTVFGRPTRYGSRLSLLIMRILPKLYGMSEWVVEAFMHTRRKVVNVRLLSSDLRPELGLTSEVRLSEVFDSSIEEAVYWRLKSLGVNVVREEEPIALGDILYLPDFKIYSGSKTYYLEVAGYWRREYAERKAYKLHEISKIVNNLILIADEKLKPYFNKLKIPVIYYKILHGKPILPYRRVLEIIRQ